MHGNLSPLNGKCLRRKSGTSFTGTQWVWTGRWNTDGNWRTHWEKENIALDLSVKPVHSVCHAPGFVAEVVWDLQSKSLLHFFETLLER